MKRKGASLRGFAVVRVLAGAAGLLWVLTLARWMVVEQFAIYTIIFASVTIASIVGTLGMDRVLYRYLPKAQLLGNRQYATRITAAALLVRVALAPIAALALLSITTSATTAMPVGHIMLFGGLLSASVGGTDVMSCTANALMRFEVQARIMLAVLLGRLATIVAVIRVNGSLEIEMILLLMLFSDLVQSTLLYFLALRHTIPTQKPETNRGTGNDLPGLRQLVPLAFVNYMSYLVGLPWQGATSRFVVGMVAGVSEVALFGFLQTLVDRLRQYLPIQLLQNAFEPILVRHYEQTQDVGYLIRHLELLRRANFVILIGIASVSWVAGSEAIAMVTAGKYSDAGVMLTCIVTALAIRGVSGILFISANVLHEMPRLTRLYTYITCALLPLLYLAATRFGAFGVIAVWVSPSVLLWLVMWAMKSPSAVGAWSGPKDFACLIAAGVASSAGEYAKTHIAGLPGLMLAVLLTLGIFLIAVFAMRVVSSGDIRSFSILLTTRHGAANT